MCVRAYMCVCIHEYIYVYVYIHTTEEKEAMNFHKSNRVHGRGWKEEKEGRKLWNYILISWIFLFLTKQSMH